MSAKRILVAILALLAVGLLGGCARAQAQSTTPDRLLGTWFDSASGGEYRFMHGSLLVVPHALAGGGNAATYRIIDGDQLDIVTANTHRVSVIESITADKLTLEDPITGSEQLFFKNAGSTAFARSLEASAQAAVSDFATTSVDPDIVWVASKPSTRTAEWLGWDPTTLNTYGAAWHWSGLKRDKTPTRTSGGGGGMGYSFGFVRKVPSPKDLAKLKADTSLDASAGLEHIDVGYSASKAQYPAGTLVYLPGGMIYTLGNGFAVGIAMDKKTQTFVPLTHR